MYGLNITSIGFRIVDPSGNPPTIFVDPDSALGGGMTFTDPGAGFLLTDPKGIEIVCRIPGDVLGGGTICSPKDVSIFFSGFNPGTEFLITSVNGLTAVPEPATLVTGDVLSGTGGRLHVFVDEADPERLLPALAGLAELPIERVIIPHGDLVLNDCARHIRDAVADARNR